MTELKLFTTPQEEMELQSLRTKVSKIYATAFTQIKLILDDPDKEGNTEAYEIYDICRDVVTRTMDLANTHKAKWEDD